MKHYEYNIHDLIQFSQQLFNIQEQQLKRIINEI